MDMVTAHHEAELLLRQAEELSELRSNAGRSALAAIYRAVGVLVATAAEAAEGPVGPFNIVLRTTGEKKIGVIKLVRELGRIGLAEAKNLVDQGTGTVLLEELPDGAAHLARERFADIGCTVVLSPVTAP